MDTQPVKTESWYWSLKVLVGTVTTYYVISCSSCCNKWFVIFIPAYPVCPRNCNMLMRMFWSVMYC